MRYPWLEEYLLSHSGARQDFKPEWQWQRFLVRDRMFAALCVPGEAHRVYGGHELLNLKCEPALGELLQKEYPHILPGFYMDKRHWIAVLLDGNVPEDVLRDLCSRSYRLVTAKLPRKVRAQLEEEASHGR